LRIRDSGLVAVTRVTLQTNDQKTTKHEATKMDKGKTVLAGSGIAGLGIRDYAVDRRKSTVASRWA